MAATARGSLREIRAGDVEAAGLAAADAGRFLTALRSAVSSSDAAATWAAVVAAGVLRPEHPHALHQLVYYSVYAAWDRAARGPPPYWFPSPAECKQTNLGRVMEENGPKLLGSSYKDPISSFNLFHKFSVENQEVYWKMVLKTLSVKFVQEPESILDTSDESKKGGKWFQGAVLNIAECCLLPWPSQNRTDDSTAIVWRDEGLDDYPVNRISLKELRTQVMTVAHALDTMFQKGDRIAIDMPMTCNAVIVYLAIILGGFVVVSIADSFAPQEIGTRMRVSNAKAIFTQDFIIRGRKKFPLYSNVMEGTPCKAIVIPATGDGLGVTLRNGDISWKDFLSRAAGRSSMYSPVYQSADALINVLFSSGTTGEPKAIPWTQLCPIRCGADTWAHLDVRPQDIGCWPTNLGWVMGPIILFSSFLSGATLALYHGSPLGRGFCKFVQVERTQNRAHGRSRPPKAEEPGGGRNPGVAGAREEGRRQDSGEHGDISSPYPNARYELLSQGSSNPQSPWLRGERRRRPRRDPRAACASPSYRLQRLPRRPLIRPHQNFLISAGRGAHGRPPLFPYARQGPTDSGARRPMPRRGFPPYRTHPALPSAATSITSSSCASASSSGRAPAVARVRSCWG